MTNEAEPGLSLSDIDELMDRDPMSLTKFDIDSIIAYHRRARARRAEGGKPEKEVGPKPKIDLNQLLGKILPPKQEIKRRI